MSATKYTAWFNLNRVPESTGVYEMAQRQTTPDGRVKFHCPPNPASIIRMKWDRNLWWRHNGMGWVVADIEEMDDLWVWRGLAEKPTLTNVNIPRDLSFSDRLKMASESTVASAA